MRDAVQALSAPPGSAWKRIFVGPQGIRAGWRLLIYFSALAAILAWNWRLLDRLQSFQSRISSFSDDVVTLGLWAAVQIVAALVLGRIERRTLSDYGFPIRLLFGKQFWMGALWGFAMISLVFAIMGMGHAYSLGTVVLSAPQILKYGLLWALSSIVWAIFYEFTFRGYAQFTLTTGLGFWPAAAITTVVYALVYFRGHWIGIIRFVFEGLFLCLALRRTGNLWFGIGWSAALSWCKQFLYSPPAYGSYHEGCLLHGWLKSWVLLYLLSALITVVGMLLLAQIYPETKYPAISAASVPDEPESSGTAIPATQS